MFTNQSSQTYFGIVEDSFQAFLVEGATFTNKEEYPIIPSRIISNSIPQNIIPFSKALNSHNDLSNTFICFYSPDKSFERVRKNPKNYIDFFKKTAGIIGFDYSIHSDMPIIKQKDQIYDNLALTYYFGVNGIPVIPNIRSGVDELSAEFFECIPKNSNVAIGTHGFMKEMSEKYEWYCFIEQVINILSPKNIIVYGSLKNHIFNDFKNKTNFICYPSWISNRWGIVKNGN